MKKVMTDLDMVINACFFPVTLGARAIEQIIPRKNANMCQNRQKVKTKMGLLIEAINRLSTAMEGLQHRDRLSESDKSSPQSEKILPEK
jgi:hypothetical protein